MNCVRIYSEIISDLRAAELELVMAENRLMDLRIEVEVFLSRINARDEIHNEAESIPVVNGVHDEKSTMQHLRDFIAAKKLRDPFTKQQMIAYLKIKTGGDHTAYLGSLCRRAIEEGRMMRMGYGTYLKK